MFKHLFNIVFVFAISAATCAASTRDLKEDTATVVVVGPFVDTAGAAVTAPTIASIDITAYKNDGTAVTITPAASGTANDMVHVDDGYYSLELTTTDTSTPGYLRLTFQISGALIFHEDFNVLPANIFDSKYSSDKLEVDVVQAGGSTVQQSGGYLLLNNGPVLLRTTINSVTSQTVFILNAGAETDNAYKGCQMVLTKTTAGEDGGPATSVRKCTGYNYDSAVRTLTIESAPDFTIVSGVVVEILSPAFVQSDDVELAAIKAKTDSLTFTSAGRVDSNVLYWNSAAIATPDTAGYPKVTIKSGAGTGEVSLTSGIASVNVTQFGGANGTFSGGRPEVNVTQISGDSTAADNAESFFDGSGFGVHQLRTTINSVTSQTNFVLNGGPETDNSLRGSTIIFRNATAGEDMGPAYSQRTITGYNYDSAVRTVTIDSAPDFTIAGGDTVEIVPPGFAYADRTAASTAQTKIGFLPSATAGAAGGVFIAGTNAATTITTGLTANITGNLSGSVGSVTGAVGSVTGAVGSVTGAVGSVTGNVGGIAGTINTFDELTDGAPTFADAMDDHGYTTARAIKLDNLDAPVSGVRASMPGLLVSTTIATLASQTSFTLTAGPPDNNVLIGALVVVTDAADATQKAVGLVKSYVGSSRTVTLVANPGIFTMAASDRVDIIAVGLPMPLWLGQ